MRDSALYKELCKEWRLYVSADKDTIQKYQHLLPVQHNPKLPFIAFQQVILRNKVTTATEEELDAIQEFINAHFQEDVDCCERLWQMLKVNDSQLDIDLERQYISK